jgi:beta-galactosidase GanA
MDEKELQAIRARAEAATSGPWERVGYDNDPYLSCTWRIAGPTYYNLAVNANKADAEFIAAARQDIPRLLDEVERLRSVLEREREAANNLLSKLSSWGYKTAGQTLPSEIGQAIFEFEMERVGNERDAR